MLEKAFTGSRRYWTLVAGLVLLVAAGLWAFGWQLHQGLQITGLGRDQPWGLYVGQFTFMVGVAASAVMVVLPYYLHDYKAFARLTILGEFLAIPAVIVCMLFIVVDMGQPARVMNVILHPTPNSMIFWDMVSLSGYLGLNVVISVITFGAERKGLPPPAWIKPVIILSIPWAVSIHTVTAFLYAGLAARPFWLTAILAPRFLASAFAAGPALLLLLCLLVRRYTKFDAGEQAMQKLREIVTYAMVANLFFVSLELFTALYSNIPEHIHHFEYMFFGLDDATGLVPWMWTSVALAAFSLVLLFSSRVRHSGPWLALACIAVFFSLWIDKGLGMVVTGFVPSPLGKVMDYTPTMPEVMITIGVYAIGMTILVVLFKIAISVREELETS